LVEKLIGVEFRAAKSGAADRRQAKQMRTGQSLVIQHLVGKSDSKSILSREQKLNQRESAIRR
jgi:hypothetical protein